MNKRGLSKKPFSFVLIILIIALIAIFLYFLITSLITKISQPLLSPTTTTVTDMIEDGWVGKENPPGINYLKDSNDQYGLKIGELEGANRRSYLEFDLSEISKSAQISQVKLRLFPNKVCAGGLPPPNDFKSFSVTKIPEHLNTYSNQLLYDKIGETAYISDQSCTAPQDWKEVDLTPTSALQDIQDRIPNGWFALGVKSDQEMSFSEAQFSSSEMSNPPELILTYTAPRLTVDITEVNLVIPPFTDTIQVTKDTSFDVKAHVCCYDMDCGAVETDLLYDQVLTSGNIKEDGTLNTMSGYTRAKTGTLNVGFMPSGPSPPPYDFIESYLEFDISTILTAAIRFLYLNINMAGTGLTNDNCGAYKMQNQPSTTPNDNSGNQILWEDARDGIYTSGTWCQSTGWKNINLGKQALADLINQLPSQWFAIGISNSTLLAQGDLATIYSSESLYQPQLIVSRLVSTVAGSLPLYVDNTLPNPDNPDFSITNLLQDTCQDLTWQVIPTDIPGNSYNLSAYAEKIGDSIVNARSNNFEIIIQASEITNVIIIDESVVTGISDLVNFDVVIPAYNEPPNEYETSTAVNSGTNPRPFVIRNEGNTYADVKVYSKNDITNLPLFDSQGSAIKFWIEQAFPIVGAAPWNAIDDCRPVPIGNGPCFASTPCTYASPCDLPFDPTGTGLGVNLALAISSLKYETPNDEAFMGIKIWVATDEGAGDKSTTIVITGSKSEDYIFEDGTITWDRVSSYTRQPNDFIEAGEMTTSLRGFIEFDITKITNPNIAKVEVKLNVNNVNEPTWLQGCSVDSMVNRPFQTADTNAGNQLLFNDAGGTAYINNGAFCETLGEHVIDLGPQAVADLINAINTGKEWFAIGISTGGAAESHMDAEESGNPAKLIITYN